MVRGKAFDIVDATIEDYRDALNSNSVTSVQLIISHLLRIATYDLRGGLNAFTVFNPDVLREAEASDERRRAGLSPRPLEGIPYTLKDSYKYKGMTVSNGSPAFRDLISNEDSGIAKKLRNAGAVLIGKTNMPPMACGGMQKGLFGSPNSPYNSKYLVAAFSSGSSSGAAVSTASSMAAFGFGSETVSSGRSPASNNALVAYTPSKGVLSCSGLWPLYVTCDVVVPYARSVGDMLKILSTIAENDPSDDRTGDFWLEQNHVQLPLPLKFDYEHIINDSKRLEGKRIGIPKMYIGQQDSNPHTKYPKISPSSVKLLERARDDLQALGAEVVYTDFPLVTKYEDDHVSGEANNVVGAPAGWARSERGVMCAKAWEDFLEQNVIEESHTNIKSLEQIQDTGTICPKPKDYLPDQFFEAKNAVDWAGLPKLAQQYKHTPITEIPGVKEALISLEKQRKRDLEEWMDENGIDCLAFPAVGDVGLADLEYNLESARHATQNGIKYSHGNRALRHMGVPTVSVPMGVLEEQQMPMNITFAGRGYDDASLLSFAYAYEQATKLRTLPSLTPQIDSDKLVGMASIKDDAPITLTALIEDHGQGSHTSHTRSVKGTVVASKSSSVKIEIFLNGRQAWETTVQSAEKTATEWGTSVDYENDLSAASLSWDLKPLPQKPLMVLVIATVEDVQKAAQLLWI